MEHSIPRSMDLQEAKKIILRKLPAHCGDPWEHFACLLISLARVWRPLSRWTLTLVDLAEKQVSWIFLLIFSFRHGPFVLLLFTIVAAATSIHHKLWSHCYYYCRYLSLQEAELLLVVDADVASVQVFFLDSDSFLHVGLSVCPLTLFFGRGTRWIASTPSTFQFGILILPIFSIRLLTILLLNCWRVFFVANGPSGESTEERMCYSPFWTKQLRWFLWRRMSVRS